MTEAERLAERTPERIWLIDMGDCIAWCDVPDPSGTGEDDAVEYVRAALIRSQAEELERLRSDITRQMAIANSECNRAERLRALIGVWEKNYANQERLPPEFETAIYSNLEGLYEDSAPPKASEEQEQRNE